MLKKYFYLLLGSCSMFLLNSSCQTKHEDQARQELLIAKQADDAEMLNRFQNIVNQASELPTAPSKEIQALNLALDASTAPQVKTILAQFDDEGSTNTPLHPLEEDSTYLDSVFNSANTKIENGAILIGVRNYDDAYLSIRQIVKQKKAEIKSEEERNNEFRLENTLVIHTAPEHFQDIMKELRNQAIVIREKRLWKQDLSTQFVDLKTRLENKYEAKSRLEQFMAQAKEVEDILPIQRELDKITEEIESVTRSARLLTQKAVSSTITATFYQEVAAPNTAEASFGEQISTGAKAGWTNFKAFLVETTYNWPYVAIGLVFFITALLAVRSSRRKTRQFKLQALQAQQQWILQQQKQQTNKQTKVNN